MDKYIKYLIITMSIGIIISIGTYAYWTYEITNKKNIIVKTSKNLAEYIVYNEGESRFVGSLKPSESYYDGLHMTVSMHKTIDIDLYVTFYMDVVTISNDISNTNAVKWAITIGNYNNKDAQIIGTGDFRSKSANDTIELVSDVPVNNVDTKYTIWVWIDKSVSGATNLSGSSSDMKVWPMVNQDANLPAKPELDDEMIPVVFDINSGNTLIKTINKNDANWYCYSKRKWANAILVTNSSKSKYLNTSGVTVSESDILGYFVWIPRYKYKVWTTNMGSAVNEQSIDIVFESNDVPKSIGTTIGSYRTHPAFTFGDTELNGIWIGKFETTGNATSPKIIPNVTSLVNQNVASEYETAKKFMTYSSTSKIDSYITRNSEWGAVAYLSHSKYGINEEIYLNNSSGIYTGRSGGAVAGDVITLASQFPGESTSTERYNNFGYYTWDGKVISLSGTIGNYADSKSLGTKASTTGNMYGVYDMVGGANEHVMGNYNAVIGNSGFSAMPDSKYYDKYTVSTMSSCTIEICGGHALFETNRWYKDYPGFVTSNYAWFARGRHYTNDTGGGIFYSAGFDGSANSTRTFRTSLIVK